MDRYVIAAEPGWYVRRLTGATSAVVAWHLYVENENVTGDPIIATADGFLESLESEQDHFFLHHPVHDPEVGSDPA